MRRLGALLAILGGVLCLVAVFVPFDTGYPPIGDPAIVPGSWLSNLSWGRLEVLILLDMLPMLFGMMLLLVFGVTALWRNGAMPGWLARVSLMCLGWVVLFLIFDGYMRMAGESTTGPALGFWLFAAGFLLGSVGAAKNRSTRPATLPELDGLSTQSNGE